MMKTVKTELKEITQLRDDYGRLNMYCNSLFELIDKKEKDIKTRDAKVKYLTRQNDRLRKLLIDRVKSYKMVVLVIVLQYIYVMYRITL